MKMAKWLNKSWCRGIERDREEVTVRPRVVLWLLLRIKEDKLHPFLLGSIHFKTESVGIDTKQQMTQSLSCSPTVTKRSLCVSTISNSWRNLNIQWIILKFLNMSQIQWSHKVCMTACYNLVILIWTPSLLLLWSL